MTEVRKMLSANDVGLTGGHQAGILIPKQPEILGFFPALDAQTRNPRVQLAIKERADGLRWQFNYIYYNNKLNGGTRNEFRLTGMTRYLRSVNAKVNDELIFSKDENFTYIIDIRRLSHRISESADENVLVLSGGWKVVTLKQ